MSECKSTNAETRQTAHRGTGREGWWQAGSPGGERREGETPRTEDTDKKTQEVGAVEDCRPERQAESTALTN